MNKKQKSLTNKGFSLVELIIVIAIMAVLVGVLAPQFIKYVEQSRRSKDIQAAANLQTAYLTDIADNQITADLGTSVTAPVEIAGNKVNDATTPGTVPTTVSSAPTVSGTATGITKFYVFADVSEGTAQVFVGNDDASTLYDLTTETGAAAYKAAN